MNEDRNKLIIAIADRIHDMTFPSIPDYYCLESYIEDAWGIRILYTDSKLADGYLRWNDTTMLPEIVVRRTNNGNTARQRFTMAHELGHLFLHWKWLPGTNLTDDTHILDVSPLHRGAIYGTTQEVNREVEADEFAGNFLMPHSEVISLLEGSFDKVPTNLNDAKMLVANYFAVSEPAAYTRMSNLRRQGLLVI